MKVKLARDKVAILATDGFEQSELFEPKQALERAGATTYVIAPHSGEIKGWDKTEWGDTVAVDVELSNADSDDYDALLLPGGVMNPDNLRTDPDAVDFVKSFFAARKPVAAICHGPWLLVEADVLDGRTVTSWPSLQTDIRNAGGRWIDEEVLVGNRLITSRNPGDIPAFTEKIIEELAERVPVARQLIS